MCVTPARTQRSAPRTSSARRAALRRARPTPWSSCRRVRRRSRRAACRTGRGTSRAAAELAIEAATRREHQPVGMRVVGRHHAHRDRHRRIHLRLLHRGGELDDPVVRRRILGMNASAICASFGSVASVSRSACLGQVGHPDRRRPAFGAVAKMPLPTFTSPAARGRARTASCGTSCRLPSPARADRGRRACGRFASSGAIIIS